MACAITMCYPLLPPSPEQITIIDPTDPSRRRKVKAWSYGAYLLDSRYDHISKSLREWVAQCLCDRPDQRPRLQDLSDAISARLQAANWPRGQGDNEIRNWSQRVFGNPPPPPPFRTGVDL